MRLHFLKPLLVFLLISCKLLPFGLMLKSDSDRSCQCLLIMQCLLIHAESKVNAKWQRATWAELSSASLVASNIMEVCLDDM